MIAGSLADRDGRIQKGDRVLSINGRSTKGITHREALSILKVRINLEIITILCSHDPRVPCHCPCWAARINQMPIDRRGSPRHQLSVV